MQGHASKHSHIHNAALVGGSLDNRSMQRYELALTHACLNDSDFGLW